MKPIRLDNPRVWRTYIGGKMIENLHGRPNIDNQYPEEWIMSTTSARSVDSKIEGLSKIVESNESLKELVERNPEELLGAEHYKKFKSDLGVLVKIIDSAERLTIQVHPDKETAKKLFDSKFGKTEAWHILDTRKDEDNPAVIYIGFKPGISQEYWKDLFRKQDIEGMLDSMHKIEVNPGETYLIHGGVPHAIGAGCMILEIQEPTDLTIRVERETPNGLNIDDAMCHQGIGFEKMFECFKYDGVTVEEILNKSKLKPKKLSDQIQQLIGYHDIDMFKLEMLEIDETYKLNLEDSYSGMYILEGKGKFHFNNKVENIEIGNQFFIPASLNNLLIEAEEPLKIALFGGPNCKEKAE